MADAVGTQFVDDLVVLDSHTLKKKRTVAVTKLTKKESQIGTLMKDGANIHLVKEQYQEYKVLQSEYEISNTNYLSSLLIPDTSDQVRFDERLTKAKEFSSVVRQWINEEENQLQDELEVGSRASRASAVSAARVQEVARLAELEIEKKMLRRKQELEAREEELQLEEEIEKARAREKALAALEAEESSALKGLHVITIQTPVISSLSFPAWEDLSPHVTSVNAPSASRESVIATSVTACSTASVLDNAMVKDNNIVTGFQGAPASQDSVSLPTGLTSVIPAVTSQSQYVCAPLPISSQAPSIITVSQSSAAQDILSLSAIPAPAVSSSPVPPVLPALNPKAPVFTPSTNMTQLLDLQREQNSQILQTHQQIAASMSLPAPQVPKFKGDPMKYNEFILAFEARIVSRATSAADRLYYLRQHLEGEPNDLIGGCIYKTPEEGYPEARALLQNEYGDPYRISVAYVNKILGWRPIRSDDSVPLKQLSLFLIKCQSAMKCMPDMTVLNHAPNMQVVISKLPQYLQNKWRDNAAKLRKSGGMMQFGDIVSFVEAAAAAANDPVFSKDAMGKNDNSSKIKQGITSYGQRGKQGKATSFAVDLNVDEKTVARKQNVSESSGYNAGNRNVFNRRCPYCNGSHELEDCSKFIDKPIDERRNFVKEKKMCFSCLKFNHTSKGCMQKKRCKACSGRHPTCLHDNDFKFKVPKESDKEAAKETTGIRVQSSACSMSTTVLHAILPVLVRQGNGKPVLTYCFYDIGSSGTFLTEELKEQLDAQGSKAMLDVKTIYGAGKQQCDGILDLHVSDLGGDNVISLPRAFTTKEIPMDKQHIPAPEVIETIPYLQEIAQEIHPIMEKVSVGLLVGVNCPAAHQPLAVIPTDGEGPYAVRLKHGWTVCGPLQVQTHVSNGQVAVHVNRIAVREQLQVREALLEYMDQDFNDSTGALHGQKALSQEDRKFLEIIESGVKLEDRHYCFPLPFRTDVCMPDNKQ